MNLLLLQPQQLESETHARVSGRHAAHIRHVLQANEGDEIKAGILNGMLGRAQITAIHADAINLQLQLDTPPPPALPLTLILALPRPKMLKRILQACTTLGIKRIYLINSYRVEKSYWQTPWLSDQAIHEQLVLGLEQARDTQLPEVLLRKRFKPFVEDELPAIAKQTDCWLAHPGLATSTSQQQLSHHTLAIGPEGGFIPYEVEKLQACGFQGLNLGERILKVETAIPVAVTRLFS